MTATRLALAALAALALAACDGAAGVDTLDCPADPGPFTLATSRVTGTVALDAPLAAPLTRGDTVVLRGTAHHEDQLALREVLVAGVSATRTTFNFGEWSASLRYEDLVLTAAPDADGNVTVPVDAIDACGLRYPITTLSLPVDLTPDLDLDTLTLTATYPGEHASIPANGTAPVTLTVVATGRAAGAAVTLAAPSGHLQGTSAASRVILLADPNDPEVASATALFYATTPGTVVLTATAEDLLATAFVTAAAAPVIAPAGATLTPGASLDLAILTDGELASCQATPSATLTATTADDTPITAAPTAVAAGPGDAAVHLAVAPEAADGDALTLTCADVWGQFAAATFTVSAPEAEPEPR